MEVRQEQCNCFFLPHSFYASLSETKCYIVSSHSAAVGWLGSSPEVSSYSPCYLVVPSKSHYTTEHPEKYGGADASPGVRMDASFLAKSEQVASVIVLLGEAFNCEVVAEM